MVGFFLFCIICSTVCKGNIIYPAHLFVFYIICPTHHLSYTQFVLHIICPTHHLSYTTFVPYIIFPTHHLSHTSFVLHPISPTLHFSYTSIIHIHCPTERDIILCSRDHVLWQNLFNFLWFSYICDKPFLYICNCNIFFCLSTEAIITNENYFFI